MITPTTLETHHQKTGKLTVIDLLDDKVPFEVKRIFYIYDVPIDTDRGGHAHIKCHQFYIAISGSVNVYDRNDFYVISLCSPDYGLYVPAGMYTRLKFVSYDARLLVLASEPYDPKDYIDENRFSRP